MKKFIFAMCFCLGIGSFLMGMAEQIYDKDEWLPVGEQVKVKNKKDIIKTYEFKPLEHKENKISGMFLIDGKLAGTCEITSEVKDKDGDYLYPANSFPLKQGTIFKPVYLKQKKGKLFIAIAKRRFPKHTERLELYKKREQFLQEMKTKADLWDKHIQSDRGLWLTKTTEGKCISGLTALLALYGTGRIVWDTKAYWKKGGQYILKLFRKRKRRKKHHHRAQEIIS